MIKRYLAIFGAMFLTLTGSGLLWAENAAVSTMAVQGYDLVSFYTEKRPVVGNGHYVTDHEGAMYQFSSDENLALFEENPEAYLPAYGGYCAYAVTLGKKLVGDPEVARIVDGKLYLNLDVRVQDTWLKDVPGNIRKADKKWVSIKNKAPRAL